MKLSADNIHKVQHQFDICCSLEERNRIAEEKPPSKANEALHKQITKLLE